MSKFAISDDTYTKLLEKYRPSSIKTMTLNLKRVLRDGFNIHHFDISPLTDIKKTTQYLNKIDNRSMRKTLLIAILAFLRTDKRVPVDLLQEYDAYFKKLAMKVNDERLYKEPSNKELDNLLTWKQVLAKHKKYKVYAEFIEELPASKIAEEDKYTYMKYLLLSLYTQIPPLRGEEYLNAIVVSIANPSLYQTIRDMTGRNLFDIKNKKFIVFAYKTSGKYGIREIDIPDSIIAIVKKWIKMTQAQLLFPVLKKLPDEISMSQESLTYAFFSIFDPKNVSTSMLRKIYISHVLKKMKDPQKRKELALTMGHSLQTQEFIYKRFEL